MGSSSTMRTRVMSAPRKQITYFQCNHSSVAIIMGLSAFFGSTGGAGDFLRLVRVDESSECRMASPWQFSPYSPLPRNVRRRARNGGKRWVPSFGAARPLSPPSVIATLNPHCLSHMPMARRVRRSSSTARMRRMTHLPRRVGRSMRLVCHPCKKDLPKERRSTRSQGQFCLANQCTIAFPPQIGGPSALYSV